MPENAPIVKKKAILNLGGQITFCKPGQIYREEATQSFMLEHESTEFIHSSDDSLIIMGQSTVSYEIFQDLNEKFDYILAPLGGGGLLGGTCLGMANFSPKTKIIGVEPELAKDGFLWFKGFNESEENYGRSTIADGLRINVGKLNKSILRQYLHDIITIDEESIQEAMSLIWETMKISVEPSSAITLAAILKDPKKFENKKVALILSGGNVDRSKFDFFRK